MKYCSTTMAQPLGQLGDGLGHVGQPLAVLQLRLRVGVLLTSRLAERVVLGGVQRQHLGAGDVVLVGGDLVGAHPGGLGDLGGRRRAAEHGREVGPGGVELAGTAAYRARGPVDAPQLVEDGAADAGAGVPVEGNPAVGVVGVGRLYEGGQAGRAEVVAIDVRRDPGHRFANDVADQGHVHHDQRLGARRDVVVMGHDVYCAFQGQACPHILRIP